MEKKFYKGKWVHMDNLCSGTTGKFYIYTICAILYIKISLDILWGKNIPRGQGMWTLSWDVKNAEDKIGH